MVDTSGQNRKELKTAASDMKSFNPVYAPLRAGGYSWIVYITRRDYGNRLNGANRQQLWITAIDDPPTATVPSDSSVGTAFSHTNLAISGLSVGDIDAAGGNETATISSSTSMPR